MKLIFDRGTILISCSPQQISNLYENSAVPESIPVWLIWDERVGAYRAPAFRYFSLKRKLSEMHEIQSEDDIQTKSRLLPLPSAWKEIPLRPYQKLALQDWEMANYRGLVAMPTGSGKTRLAIAALAKRGVRSLCVLPTRVLVEQWKKEISSFYLGPVGVYSDGERDLQPITVATYESAYRSMPYFGDYFDFLVIDEVHHFGVGRKDELLEMSLSKFRLGLSATVPAEQEVLKRLNLLVGPTVYEVRFSQLKGVYLADFEIYTFMVDLESEERSQYDYEMGLFLSFSRRHHSLNSNGTWGDLVRYASRSKEGRNALVSFKKAKNRISYCHAKQKILRNLVHQLWEHKTIIFTSSVEDTFSISKDFLIMPITADIGKKERESVLNNYQLGKIRALVACRVLNEGFNVPDAKVAVIVGGALGEREHLQRIGRILRPSEGKRALIYELVCRDTIEVKQWNKRRSGIDTHFNALP